MIRLTPSVLYLLGLLTLQHGHVEAESTIPTNPPIDISDRKIPGYGNQPTVATVTAGTNVYTINPTNIVLTSQKIAPGEPPMTVNGEPMSEDVSHNSIAAGSTIYEFHWSNTSTQTMISNTEPSESAAMATLTSTTGTLLVV